MKQTDDDMAPVIERPISPDAWAAGNLYRHHEMTSDDLERLTQEYLSKGNRIMVIPFGVSAGEPSADYRITNAVGYNGAHGTRSREDVLEKATKRIYGADDLYVKKLDHFLGYSPSRKAILNHLGVSDDKLQRILKTYFKGDSRVTKYLRKQDM